MPVNSLTDHLFRIALGLFKHTTLVAAAIAWSLSGLLILFLYSSDALDQVFQLLIDLGVEELVPVQEGASLVYRSDGSKIGPQEVDLRTVVASVLTKVLFVSLIVELLLYGLLRKKYRVPHRVKQRVVFGVMVFMFAATILSPVFKIASGAANTDFEDFLIAVILALGIAVWVGFTGAIALGFARVSEYLIDNSLNADRKPKQSEPPENRSDSVDRSSWEPKHTIKKGGVTIEIADLSGKKFKWIAIFIFFTFSLHLILGD